MIEINFNPPKRELRLFGGVWTPLFLGIGGAMLLIRHGQSSWPTAVGLWVVGAVGMAIGWTAPLLLRWIYVALMVITFPLGWVMSHVILALIFYGVVTPVGLLMRAVGRDPLHCKFDRSAKTYWVPHISPADKRRYFRQY